MFDVPAILATCTDATNNDPAACVASTTVEGFSVDQTNGSAMNLPTYGFVGFDLGAVPQGAQIVSATFILHTTNTASADADQTGEVWRTEPFTLASLGVGQPTAIGNAPIAPDMGAVVADQDVSWSLPVDAIDPSAGLYLAILPVSTQGVDYWSTAGDVPPRLVLEALIPL